jgi:hypothetical protein
VELQRRGVFVLLVVSSNFEAMARLQSTIAGADLPMVVLTHPLGGLTPAQLQLRIDEGAASARAVLDQVASGLTHRPAGSAVDAGSAETLRVGTGDGGDSWQSSDEAGQWSDGLPTVAPTPDRVEEFIAGLSAEARSITFLPLAPAYRTPTLRSIAANAVMAGCAPSYLPVVLAAVSAAQQDQYNLRSVIPTTHPCAPMIVVNGPVRDEIGMNYGTNCLGQGNRANATIGRALQFVLRNIAGARPGVTDQATHGSPGKYTYCFAENELESPWLPFHVRRGFEPGQSVVTVFAAEPPHNLSEHGASDAGQLVVGLANTISASGNNNVVSGGSHLVVICPEHASLFKAAGMTPEQVQRELFNASRVHEDRLSDGTRESLRRRGRFPVNHYYPVGESAETLQLLVAGGAGRHSCWIPTLARSTPTSAQIL